MNATLTENSHSTINGRNIWHYTIDSPIGEYHFIHWEREDMSIDEYITRSNQKAEKKYNEICKKILKGKI